jgi:hypothetical protein
LTSALADDFKDATCPGNPCSAVERVLELSNCWIDLLSDVSDVFRAPVSATNAFLTAEMAARPVVSTAARLVAIPLTLPVSLSWASELLKLLTAGQYAPVPLPAVVVLALAAGALLAAVVLLEAVVLLLLLPHPANSNTVMRPRTSRAGGWGRKLRFRGETSTMDITVSPTWRGRINQSG